MGRLESAKTIGGIGSILEIIPFLSIVGYILTLVAVKYVSDEVQDGTIFTDMVYAVVAGIAGAIVAAFSLFLGVLPPVFTLGIRAFFGLIWFLVIIWIAFIISAIFVRSSFNKIATRLNNNTFRTAGTLYFVGALLTIIVVGFIVIFVALILQIIAFFSIQETQPTVQQTSAGTPQQGFKYCPNCGSQVALSATYCPKCGAKQP